MWVGEIKVKDRARDLVRVYADHYNIDNEKDYHISFPAIISTQAQRTDVFKKIKDDYEMNKIKETADSLFLAGLDDTLTNALNDWENE